MERTDLISLQELMKGRNPDFDASSKICIVRHADTRKPQDRGIVFQGTLLNLYRENPNLFMQYQCQQKKGKFQIGEYIVVCIGERSTQARFITVYQVTSLADDPDAVGYIGETLTLEEVPGFDILKERVVIDWGKGAVSWKQNFFTQTKEVLWIDKGKLNANNVPNFTSYEDTLLSFADLKRIIESGDKEWEDHLKAVNCVYLIHDNLTGKNYVGETHGKDGIWGRWNCYVETAGHGNNVELMKLVKQDLAYARHFQWCILETLRLNIPQEEAVDRESLYKQKFGTRSDLGYNKN